MRKLLSIFGNSKLLAFSVILVVYFYYMLINFFTGDLSIMAVLCVFCLFAGGIPYLFQPLVQHNRLCRKVIPWFFWSLLMCLLYFNSLGQTASSVLWILAILCTYSLVNTQNDITLVIIFVTIICVMSLAFGAFTLNIGAFIDAAGLQDSQYDVNENIGVYILITLPIIALINLKILKWGLLIASTIVILLTARRTATICIVIILILCIIQELKASASQKGFIKKYLFPIILISGIIYGFYSLMTGDFAVAFERTIERFLEVKDDGGSGRSALYNDVWKAFTESNILEIIIGHGYHGVNRVTGHTASHNDFLQYLFDYGIIGLVFYCSLHIYLLKRLIHLFKYKNNLVYSYSISYCVFLFYSLLGNIIIYPQYFLTIPVYWGMAEKIITRDIQYVQI